MNKMAQIQIQNIEKSFGEFRALKGIDLQIADQEFLVLLGASGCGKSTLLRIMAGLETADGGHIHVGENRIDNLAPRDRGLSMVFQNYAVFPHLTVFENIAFGLRMQKKPQAWVEKKVQEVAELVHLEVLLHRYSGQLSGGQRQRVALARALAVEPKVILMDIVMEHNQAGLEAVQQIRNNGHHHVRILVRTGQPGDLSERTVVETHPIDGYLTKSDLTHPHLYSSVYVALKHYQELASLQAALTQARHCYIDPH